ncbi:MAG: DUF721 domain-containing protein [Alphaproteobacteria bacterium]|nr:DUF721 domain-containing protein [Alphaproteobacteria bacterium]
MSDKTTDKPSSIEIKRRGPHAFAGDAGALLKHHLASHGFGDADLVTRWPAIAGAQLAQRCLPQRLSGKGEDGATLTLLADDRAALELQHQTPQLISKINTYFGRTVVKKIKVIVGDIPQAFKPPPPVRPLTSAEQKTLADSTEAISDPDLKAALRRLGRYALTQKRKGPQINSK